MGPISVKTPIDAPRESVYELLCDLANRPAFTDHFVSDYRLQRLVYGAAEPKAGAVASLYRLLEDPRLNHRVRTRGAVLEAASAALLGDFFETKRRQPRGETE